MKQKMVCDQPHLDLVSGRLPILRNSPPNGDVDLLAASDIRVVGEHLQGTSHVPHKVNGHVGDASFIPRLVLDQEQSRIRNGHC